MKFNFIQPYTAVAPAESPEAQLALYFVRHVMFHLGDLDMPGPCALSGLHLCGDEGSAEVDNNGPIDWDVAQLSCWVTSPSTIVESAVELAGGDSSPPRPVVDSSSAPVLSADEDGDSLFMEFSEMLDGAELLNPLEAYEVDYMSRVIAQERLNKHPWKVFFFLTLMILKLTLNL